MSEKAVKVKLTKEQKREKRTSAQEKKFERSKRSLLNRYFHHVDHGSTTGREIMAGLLLCILCVCAIFMNMQLITSMMVSGPAAAANSTELAANGEIIASQYFWSMIIAFIGSLAIGLVARLPLTQIPSLGLSTLLISALGIGMNLTYANLLAVCFISSIVYAVIAAVPAVRSAVLKAIPAPVRKAAPVALGMIVVFIAMQLTGIVSMGTTNIAAYGAGTEINAKKMSGLQSSVMAFRLFDFSTYNSVGYKGDSYYPLIQISMVSAAIALATFVLLRKTKRPVMHALMIGTLTYFVWMLLTVVFYKTKNGAWKYSLDVLWGRLWMVGSEDAQHLHLANIFRSLNLGSVFTEGFDFSAYTQAGGSVITLFASGILTFLFANLTVTGAVAHDADDKETGLAMICNAGINVLAPLVGVTAVAVTPLNEAGRRDGAKSGLASVIASLGFLASAFVWLVPFFFSTTSSYNIQFNMYGHYGTSMQMFSESGFIVVDAVMALVGLCMAASALKDGIGEGKDAAAFVATIAGTLLLSSLPLGVAAGMTVYALANALDRERSLTIGQLCGGVVSLGYIVLTLI